MVAEFSDEIARSGLVRGRDYPRTYRELGETCPDDAACAPWLEQRRWPRGFVCPRCGTAAAAGAWGQARSRPFEVGCCDRRWCPCSQGLRSTAQAPGA